MVVRRPPSELEQFLERLTWDGIWTKGLVRPARPDQLGEVLHAAEDRLARVTRVRGLVLERLNEPPRNYMYLPLFQFYRPDVTLIVRTAESNASGILAAVRS